MALEALVSTGDTRTLKGQDGWGGGGLTTWPPPLPHLTSCGLTLWAGTMSFQSLLLHLQVCDLERVPGFDFPSSQNRREDSFPPHFDSFSLCSTTWSTPIPIHLLMLQVSEQDCRGLVTRWHN